MAAYWDHHARADLDRYVEVVQAVKADGLPVVLGLEVDFYPDRMDEVAELLGGYPFDVLLGSVHWLGAWRFDCLDEPEIMAEWRARDIDAVWADYTRAMEELGSSGACDVFAHPDLIKVAGHAAGRAPTSSTTASPRPPSARAWPPSSPRRDGASRWARSTRRRRCSSAWSARGVPLTTASDAHSLPDVADRAGELRGILSEAGVDRLQGFRRRQPRDVALAAGGR